MTPPIDWKVVHNNIICRETSTKAILKDTLKSLWINQNRIIKKSWNNVSVQQKSIEKHEKYEEQSTKNKM